MREINGIDELEHLIGESLGASDWVTIDQNTINLFADATGDHQWIHIDEEKAQAGPFGSTIAHGFLTLSLIPRLAADVFTVSGVKMKINYGLNKVRFPQPVPVNARLRDVVSVKEVQRKESGIQAILNHVLEIEGSERPACIAEQVTLLIED